MADAHGLSGCDLSNNWNRKVDPSWLLAHQPVAVVGSSTMAPVPSSAIVLATSLLIRLMYS